MEIILKKQQQASCQKYNSLVDKNCNLMNVITYWQTNPFLELCRSSIGHTGSKW